LRFLELLKHYRVRFNYINMHGKNRFAEVSKNLARYRFENNFAVK